MTSTLNRPYHTYDGRTRYIPLEICHCGVDRRGPAGGVCSRCGDAIPDEHEQQRLNHKEDVMPTDTKYDPNQPKEKEDEKKKKPEEDEEEEEETDKRQEQEPHRR